MKGNWNKLLCLALGLILVLGLAACSGGGDTAEGSPSPSAEPAPSETQPAETGGGEEGDTFLFTDSTGREVELPRQITKVASGGSLANIMIYAVKPECLVGWSSSPSEISKKYIDEAYWDLPEYGNFYSDAGDFNREALMASDPDVIIDIGEWDEEYKADLDTLQEQVGIPVILIECDIDENPAAYRTLGELLGEEERGEALAAYCEEVISEAQEKAATIPEEDRVQVYYGQDDGLSTILSGTIHSQIYELVGADIVVQADNAQIQQGGGTISMEQLLAWDPDVIMFVDGSVYDQVADDPTWSALSAIQNDTYYEIPVEPYNWLGRPPGPNRMIGVRWLGNLLYPDLYDYDIEQEVKDYFSLFYRYDLSDEEVQGLLANSTLKAQAQREAS